MAGPGKKGDGIHAGHRGRIRERFRHEGLSGFSEHEVLELLLTYAIPQRDVNPLAHELIAHFGSLANVLEADEFDLLRVSGVGANAAALLTLVPQLLGYYQLNRMGDRPLVNNLASAKQYCDALFFGAHEERVYLLSLDKLGRVIYTTLLQTGTLDQVTLYPRTVVEIALRHRSYAVMLVHNHPGGFPEPSQADYDTTRALIKALSLVGVRMVDHLILSGDDVYSMAQHSQHGDDVDSLDFSYCVRSSSIPGVRGDLNAQDETGLNPLTEEQLRGDGQ